MKKYNIIIVITIIIITAFSSCDSYLDIKQDEELNFEKIWKKRTTIEEYLNNTYGFFNLQTRPKGFYPFWGATDEASESLPDYHTIINNGTWNISNVPFYQYDKYYQGIREANIFMKNIVTVNVDDVSEDEKVQWFNEARFVRAYYYWMLIEIYGPVMLVGDEPIDFTLPVVALYKQRNSMDECVEYIASEFEACSQILPIAQPTIYYGKPTKGACYAFISELRLYTARPLFNGNTLYKDLKNPDDSYLFPNIATVNINKWKLAADAAKRIIDTEQYSLYKVTDSFGNIDPAKSYQGVFLKNWNEELIFARWVAAADLRRFICPRVTAGSGAWGSYAPTQQQVDAYAMSNGKYPITGYNSDGSPIIDPSSGYEESGFANFTHPLDQPTTGALHTKSTYKMYINREPRFYASVLWSGCDLPYLASGKVVNFAFNGNSGPGPSQNAPNSGYLVRKQYDPALNNNAQQWGTMTFPIFRYAEILLNYVEALNEYEPTNADITFYLDQVRERAGVPPIESVYPDAVNNQAKMRELIRHERRIELAFESKRYFDTRTWMISKEVDNGPMWGMNAQPDTPASNTNVTPANFWKRTVFETRIFKDKDYLYPFAQKDILVNKLITNNYGW